MTDTLLQPGAGAPSNDILVRGILVAALVLFVAFAAEALPLTLGALLNGTAGPDGTLAGGLSANVALLLFSWRIGPSGA